MNEKSRTVLLAALGELERHYPHWRFGQLVSNVAGWADVDLWDIDDERLLVAATAHLEHLKNRERTVTATSTSAP
jgi:hypothetical protein